MIREVWDPAGISLWTQESGRSGNKTVISL